MATTYFCAHCDYEFVPDELESKPRCPKCMRRGGVEAVKQVPPASTGRSRGLVIAVLLLALAGIGYGVYRSTAVTLEDTPPLRPLTPKELAAYLQRDQIGAGAYESMLVPPATVEEWPSDAADAGAKLSAETATWSLEVALPREVLTAGQLFAKLESSESRVKAYPLELASALTALLREQGVRAMVAETWELEGTGTPPDPSGLLGYFVTAVYEGSATAPSSYVDPWGNGRVDASAVRVLRDTEVIAAALGTEAARIFTRSGDGAKALPLIETALRLDPVSPTLRGVNATVLIESGGLPQALEELESARQLRSDGPRQLNLVQLLLAQAGLLQMNGELSAAEAQFNEGQRIVGDVLERWPRYGRARVMLATILLGLGDPARALIELEAAESATPDSTMLWTIWAQYDLERGDSIAAAQKVKRALALDPDNWQLLIQAARVFHEAGDESLASQTATAAVARVPASKRAEVQRFLEEAINAQALAPPGAGQGAPGRLELPDPTLGASPPPPDAAREPGLILGDPSNLRLRDPDQRLKLDLEE